MILLIFVLSILGLSVAEDPVTCCQKGYVKGATVLVSDISCEPPQSLINNFNNTMRILCSGFYKHCCKLTAEMQQCKLGEQLAIANLGCMSSSSFGGKHKRECCNCCKRGANQAKAGGSCQQQQADALCDNKFKACCNRVKLEITNTTKTTSKPSSKTCAGIACDKATTRGCIIGNDGPKCICQRGYVAKNDGITCVDIDECARKPSICHGSCVNTLGSYKCQCQTGHKKVGNKCVKYEKCKTGFEFKNGKCQDFDECITGKHKCPDRSYCMNTEGDYRCLFNCPYPNYEVQTAGVCQDVDECKRKYDTCHENFRCENTVGGYNCVREKCSKGYKLVNGYCEDIDECDEDPSICGKKGICRNAHGRYYCDCERGYEIDDETGKCADVNECKVNRGSCEYNCINTEGSYKCTCPSGYQTRGNYCYDIDECARNPCTQGTYCFNNFGSYACINQSCPSRFFIARSSQNNIRYCHKTYCNGDKECSAIIVQSVKRVAYKFYKVLPVGGFIFNYWTSFSNRYRVTTRFVKGNEENAFVIRPVSSSQLKITNQKNINGPRTYKLVMHTDVRTATGVLNWRYKYHFYIYVSAYNFA